MLKRSKLSRAEAIARSSRSPLPEYVMAEHQRNVAGRGLYVRLLQRAFGDDAQVVVSHHILVIRGEEPEQEVTEIPAADTILFCPNIMGRVFGIEATSRMITLVLTTPADRERRVSDWLDELQRVESAMRAL